MVEALSNPVDNIKTIHILVGCLNSSIDSTERSTLLANEYGKDKNVQNIKETLLTRLKIPNVHVHDTTLAGYKDIIAAIKKEATSEPPFAVVVLNLCDGNETTDGYPGISVIKELETANLPFTGSNSYFYRETTSKPVLKRLLQKSNVSTSKFVEVDLSSEASIRASVLEAVNMLSWPLIIKPSVSYASISIGEKSIVWNEADAIEQIQRVSKTSCGAEGIFIEKFLPGKEFTGFITGSKELGFQCYHVAERVFDQKLPKYKRFLAFDRYWAGYDLEQDENETKKAVSDYKIYEYKLVEDASVHHTLRQLVTNAYEAVGGDGYGRVDIRSCDESSEGDIEYFVLEVNANCGMSFDDSTSAGEILRISNVNVLDFIKDLLKFAIERAKIRQD